MTYQSGRTSVSGNVTAVPNKVTATVVTLTQNGAGGPTTIGTVGAGKVWRILSVGISHRATNTSGYTKITLNGVDFLYLTLNAGATTFNQDSQNVSWDYGACPVLAATQTVTITVSGNINAQAFVSYVEEAA